MEPFCGTVDQDSGEGCTCSGSWQPRCCCPNPQNCPHPRRYNLPPCRPQQPTTCSPPSCIAPPIAKTTTPYPTIQYSPLPSTSCPDLPYSTPCPCPCPCNAPVAVPAGPSSCAPQQLPCPSCTPQQQPSCPGAEPPLSVNFPSNFANEYVSSSTQYLASPQRPMLPKFIPVALKPLSFNIHRPSALCRPGLGVYGGPAPSLFSSLGCNTPSPYEFYNYK